ncbi:beta-microseminoprotein-like [Takifugu rubripes]|uniref:beta-microseminoprotein-like n=1 Tax=Takifugu rubripes TaxID=31033 RepID=UPI0011459301|nr:beta-microseminoprotein-like [Takifugu rubripes]
MVKDGLCKHYLRRAPFNIDTTIPPPKQTIQLCKFHHEISVGFGSADICSGVTLTCFLLCQATRKDMTHCMDETDGTWHAIGSSWRDSECMDCTCAGCCSAFSIPSSFDDDCISVFDKVACEYKVYKKDNPSISCPIYGAVGK